MEKHQNKKKQQTSCDTCARLIYDEDYEGYVCDVDMDEDELHDKALQWEIRNGGFSGRTAKQFIHMLLGKK